MPSGLAWFTIHVMAENSSSIWLIKSRGRVFGPFTKTEVESRVKEREFGLLDEVASPLRRWVYIKDQAAFQGVVEELKSPAWSDRTEATWGQTQSEGFTHSITEPLDPSMLDDLTEDLSQRSKEIVLYDVKEEKVDRATKSAYGRYQTIGQTEPSVQARAHRSTWYLWTLTLGLVLSVSGYVLYKKFLTDPSVSPYQGSSVGPDDILQSLELGDYVSALAGLKQLKRQGRLSDQFQLFYGVLLIQLESQTVVGQEVLAELLRLNPTLKEAYTGMAIAKMQLNQFELADTNLDKALEVDPYYCAALINRGLLNGLESKWLEAKALLISASDRGCTEGEIVMGLADAALRLGSEEPRHLSEALSILEDYFMNFQDYRMEVRFLIELLQQKLVNEPVEEEALIRVLDLNPGLADSHRHNVLVYRQPSIWQRHLESCLNMGKNAKENKETPFSDLFEGVCLLKAGRRTDARSHMEAAMAARPKDPLILSWYAYTLTELGLNDQAAVALGRAQEGLKGFSYDLPLIMLGMFCEEKSDWSCAHQAWRELYQRRPRSVEALMGLANFNIHNKQHDQAMSYIRLAKSASAHYIPVLKAEKLAKKEKWHEEISK